MKNATIKDIAQLTHLSVGTVSKYINGGSVKQVNKKKLDEAIQKLDFHVNNFARGLKTKHSATIGVLIPSLDNYFCTTLVGYIEQDLSDFGYSVIVCGYQGQVDKQRERLRLLMNQMVDGIIVVPSFAPDKLLEFQDYPHIPIVFVDRVFKNSYFDTVAIKNQSISFDLTSELIAKGHSLIGIVLGPKQISTSKERLEGYVQAMHDHDLDINSNFVLNGSYSMEHGYAATMHLLTRKHKPTVIFATNFDITLGMLKAIHELSMNVPKDISIVGFDNLQISSVFEPPLTIIEQPMEKIAKEVVKRLLGRINGKITADAKTIRVSAKIVEGLSVRKL